MFSYIHSFTNIFVCVIVHICTLIQISFKHITKYRNRYLELRKYHLDLDAEGSLNDFSVDEREVATMRRTGRVELPDSFIRRIRVIRMGKELVCEGYTISTKFPDNIVLLSHHRVIYCIDFSEEPDPAGHPGFKKFTITGHY